MRAGCNHSAAGRDQHVAAAQDSPEPVRRSRLDDHQQGCSQGSRAPRGRVAGRPAGFRSASSSPPRRRLRPCRSAPAELIRQRTASRRRERREKRASGGPDRAVADCCRSASLARADGHSSMPAHAAVPGPAPISSIDLGAKSGKQFGSAGEGRVRGRVGGRHAGDCISHRVMLRPYDVAGPARAVGIRYAQRLRPQLVARDTFEAGVERAADPGGQLRHVVRSKQRKLHHQRRYPGLPAAAIGGAPGMAEAVSLVEGDGPRVGLLDFERERSRRPERRSGSRRAACRRCPCPDAADAHRAGSASATLPSPSAIAKAMPPSSFPLSATRNSEFCRVSLAFNEAIECQSSVIALTRSAP